MKHIRLLPIIIIASLLFSACSGVGFSLAVPAAAITNGQSGQLSPVSAPLAGKPVLAKQQTITDVAGLQNAYETIYQQVNPSVVTIEISSQVSNSTRSRGSGGLGSGQNGLGSQNLVVPTAEGSGFVWDSAGHIVTNNHVVEGASKISVTFSDGSSYAAKVVGTDPNSDLAVIQVTGAPDALLKPISIGDSSQVKVGELVVAIGNPYGLSNTMTTGIVSAIARSIQASSNNSNNSSQQNSLTTPLNFSIPDVIQTDAAINPGNSGGVLVDMNGALIGVPSQIESASGSNSGVGFAIPSAIVNRVVPQLISKGAATHSYLGLSGSTITSDIIGLLNLKAGQQGILVASVIAGGPAEKAGLKPATVDANDIPTAAGDIITGIDGKAVTRFEDMVSYLSGSTQPGQTVTITVLRDSKEIQIKVVLGTQPTN
jgi:serine protease Do